MWSETINPCMVSRLVITLKRLPGPQGDSSALYWEISPHMTTRPAAFDFGHLADHRTHRPGRGRDKDGIALRGTAELQKTGVAGHAGHADHPQKGLNGCDVGIDSGQISAVGHIVFPPSFWRPEHRRRLPTDRFRSGRPAPHIRRPAVGRPGRVPHSFFLRAFGPAYRGSPT